MMRLIGIALLSVFLCGLPRPGPAEEGAGVPVILALGDSLTAAYGMALQDGWVALLRERLRARGFDYAVVNAGISGDTTAGGLARLPDLLRRHRPAVLIVALGANDGLRGLPPPMIAENLRQIIRLGREAGARVLLAGIQLPPNYGAAFNRSFQAVFPDLARTEGVPLVPGLLAGVAEDRALMQPDDIHPTAAAQPRILDNVWPALAPLLTAAAPSGG
jgi:acyl-CoA thioesterase-1